MTPKMVQQALIEDEDLSADLADLVPAASKIVDAAAAYLSKADKKYSSELASQVQLAAVTRTIAMAQEVVKYGAAIGRLLREPANALQQVHDADSTHFSVTIDGERTEAASSELEDALA